MKYIGILGVFLGLIFLAQPVCATFTIWVSIEPQKEWVKAVGGDKVSVNVLLPSGVSPETYELSAKKLQGIMDADIYFPIGLLPFETSVMQVFKHQGTGLSIVETQQFVEKHLIKEDRHVHHNHGGSIDPHIWLSLPMVKAQVRGICEALCDKDPNNKQLYIKNLQQYLLELENLNNTFKEMFSARSEKYFLVVHPSYAYFAREYGLYMDSIEHDGKTPSMKSFYKTLATAKNKGVRTVFVEPSINKEWAFTAASALQGSVVELDPLAGPYLEAMHQMGTAIQKAL